MTQGSRTNPDAPSNKRSLISQFCAARFSYRPRWLGNARSLVLESTRLRPAHRQKRSDPGRGWRSARRRPAQRGHAHGPTTSASTALTLSATPCSCLAFGASSRSLHWSLARQAWVPPALRWLGCSDVRATLDVYLDQPDRAGYRQRRRARRSLVAGAPCSHRVRHGSCQHKFLQPVHAGVRRHVPLAKLPYRGWLHSGFHPTRTSTTCRGRPLWTTSIRQLNGKFPRKAYRQIAAKPKKNRAKSGHNSGDSYVDLADNSLLMQ